MLCVTITMVNCSLSSKNQLFDLAGGDRIQGRAGLVHQQHLRLHRQGARDAQPLLLTAGEAGTRLLAERILDLIPQRRELQRALDNFIQPLAIAESV